LLRCFVSIFFIFPSLRTLAALGAARERLFFLPGESPMAVSTAAFSVSPLGLCPCVIGFGVKGVAVGVGAIGIYVDITLSPSCCPAFGVI
jgi:hypothetical protein